MTWRDFDWRELAGWIVTAFFTVGALLLGLLGVIEWFRLEHRRYLRRRAAEDRARKAQRQPESDFPTTHPHP